MTAPATSRSAIEKVLSTARLSDAERDAIMVSLPDRRSLIRPEKLALF